MKHPSQFHEFLKLLASNGVDFTLIGGYAVAFHGFIRYTADIDILYRRTPENMENLKKTLMDFGFPISSLPDSLFEPGQIIRIGVPPVRIELLNEISGVSPEEVWNHRVPGMYEKVKVHFIGLDELIRNKKAAGRPKDLQDLNELQ